MKPPYSESFTDASLKEIEKLVHEYFSEIKLRLEAILLNNFLYSLLKRHKENNGFPPLTALERLLQKAGKDLQDETYNFITFYELTELLAYFVYHCKVKINLQEEAIKYSQGSNTNSQIQARFTLETFPKNTQTLGNTVMRWLLYLTCLERSTKRGPYVYSSFPMLLKVDSLIKAPAPIPEAQGFEELYENYR